MNLEDLKIGKNLKDIEIGIEDTKILDRLHETIRDPVLLLENPKSTDSESLPQSTFIKDPDLDLTRNPEGLRIVTNLKDYKPSNSEIRLLHVEYKIKEGGTGVLRDVLGLLRQEEDKTGSPTLEVVIKDTTIPIGKDQIVLITGIIGVKIPGVAPEPLHNTISLETDLLIAGNPTPEGLHLLAVKNPQV